MIDPFSDDQLDELFTLAVLTQPTVVVLDVDPARVNWVPTSESQLYLLIQMLAPIGEGVDAREELSIRTRRQQRYQELRIKFRDWKKKNAPK